MSPIDDELRATLQGRAALLAPSPDPMAGIERRAGRIRRNRAATAIAGSVLAVAMIALAVPALSTAPTSAPVLPAAPSAAPSPAPSAAPSTLPGRESARLDPAAPWPYRGDITAPAGELATLTRQWAALKGAPAADVTFTLLYGQTYGQTYGPAATRRFVYLAFVHGSRAVEHGLVTATESGPQFLSRSPLTTGATALLVPAPGDGTHLSLLVLAAPGSRSLEYAPNGTGYRPMVERADGVAITAVDGDSTKDRVRVTGADGSRVFEDLAPQFSDSGELAAVGDPAGAAPANLLDWPQRGVGSEGPTDRAVLDRLTAAGYAAPQFRRLFSGSNDAGVRYVFGQAWSGAGPALTVALATGGTEGEQLLLGPDTPKDPAVLAFVVCCSPGTTTETLVVVPQPRTGQVLYDNDGTGPLRPVGEGQDLDGVVLVDRDPRAQDDRLQVLDGNGNLDTPTFRGPVSRLLCGRNECG